MDTKPGTSAAADPPARSLSGRMADTGPGRFLAEVASITRFVFRFLREALRPPFEIEEILKQAHAVGYKSLPLIGITGFIFGLVLTIQSRPTLARLGAESWLPAMVSISIIREIGPVISALIFAGKVGSGIGAELASMSVTEQIDAMKVSRINPFRYLVVTRVIATTLMLPLLVIFTDAISLLGALVGVNIDGHISVSLFVTQVFESLEFGDLVPALVKTVFFGFAIGLISCYNGYSCRGGTIGVGKAANAAVVWSSLSIFVIDVIAVQLTNLLQG
jgi:phospholipid/cholesterol/gamma-HCH transport system permease protein